MLAIEVHDRVDALSAAGLGIQNAGRPVQRGFDSAAGAVDGVPLVGGELSGALSGAGEGTGGEAVAAGRTAEQAAGDAAFGLPCSKLLRHTPDPLGDLAAGRHDRLVAALAEDAGLCAPGA